MAPRLRAAAGVGSFQEVNDWRNKRQRRRQLSAQSFLTFQMKKARGSIIIKLWCGRQTNREQVIFGAIQAQLKGPKYYCRPQHRREIPRDQFILNNYVGITTLRSRMLPRLSDSRESKLIALLPDEETEKTHRTDRQLLEESLTLDAERRRCTDP